MNQLSQRRLIEFGNGPPHLRVVTEPFDAFQDFSQEPLSDVGNTLFRVPLTKAGKIGQRRLR